LPRRVPPLRCEGIHADAEPDRKRGRDESSRTFSLSPALMGAPEPGCGVGVDE